MDHAHVIMGVRNKEKDAKDQKYDKIAPYSMYYDGEQNLSVKSVNAPAGFQPMQSRSSASFNHPPIQDVYRNEMAGITEEDAVEEDGECVQLVTRHHMDNVADASSLVDANLIPHTPPPKQTEQTGAEDLFNKPRLSSQEIRYQNYKRYSAEANHKQVMTPSFSISPMEGHHRNSTGSPSKALAKTSVSDGGSMISLSQVAVAQTLDFDSESLQVTDEVKEMAQTLQLDLSVAITHQTKSVMVDPTDVEHAWSLQSKQSLPLKEEYVAKSAQEVAVATNQAVAALDCVYERDQSESLQENALRVEPHYDQILHKPRTGRTWAHQNIQNKQKLLLKKETEDSHTSSDSYDTHTPSTASASTAQSSSAALLIHKERNSHYEYNKIITINTNKQK
eukprot:280777_1